MAIDDLIGGPGDDIFVVDGFFDERTDIPVYDDCGEPVPGAVTRVWTTDTVVEEPDQGDDLVISSADYTLTENVERLQLASGAADAILGRGNAGNNIIEGNENDNRLEGAAGEDMLFGGAGDDVLDGGADADLLIGQAGSDVYNFGPGSGVDLVLDDSDDQVHIIQDLPASAISLARNGDDVTIALLGSGDRMTLNNWFGRTEHARAITFCNDPLWDEQTISDLADAHQLFAADDFASLEEDGTLVTGNVLDNDSSTGTVGTVSVGGTIFSLYGTVEFGSDGAHSYTLNNYAVQFLAEGESTSVDIGYTIEDEGGAAGSATLHIAIAGANDAPVAEASFAAVEEQDPGELLVSGPNQMFFSDADHVDTHTISFAPQAAGYVGGFDALLVQDSQFGNPGVIDWTFSVLGGAIDYLAEGETLQQLYDVTVDDGHGGVVTQAVTVDTVGSNDAPQIDFADSFGLVVEDDSPGGVQSASGSIQFSDVDLSDAHSLAVQTLGTDYLGEFSAPMVLDSTGSGFGSAAWNFNLDDAAIDFLREGETLAQEYDVTIDDGHADGSATQRIRVEIVGANDAPVTLNDAAAVREDVTLTASGNVLANDTDIDNGTVLSAVLVGSAAGAYGTLSLAANGSYTYTLDNAASGVQRLRAGASATEAFSYAASDGITSTNATLTVTVLGTNDVPVVANPIADQNADAGSPFSFTFAPTTFADVDQGDALGYSAKLADGSNLPFWLTFNAATRTFTGTPPGSSPASLDIRVTATDGSNATVFDDFAVDIAGGGGEEGRLIIGTPCDDVLTGADGDDVIDGREGFDRMSGGKGDDIYFVDKTGNKVDQVIENDGEGYDTVYADTDYTAAANVEEVRLLGCEGLKAKGNGLDNVLVGNEGDNGLSGGAGADTYVYSLHDGDDVIDEKGTANQVDTLKLQGASASSVRVNRKNNDLVVDFPGRDGGVTIKNWFANSAFRVERFEFDDGTVWNESQIASRVGKKVAPVRDYVDDSPHKHRRDRDDDHHGHPGHGHDDGEYEDDRHSHHNSDEAILSCLKQPVSFSFEAITRALGGAGPTLSAEEVARRWATARDYFCDDAHCGDHHDGAVFPSLKDLGLGGRDDHHCGFGFEGSTGSKHGHGEMECFRGLSDGFRKL